MRKNGRAREVLELVGHMLHDAVEHPELYPDRLTIVLLDEEMERKVLTPQRLRLLRTLRQREVDSIKELATILKRPIESVSRDLKLLEGHGLVRMERNGRCKRPRVTKDFIAIPL
ncbi:hypothetical protein DRN52_04100 [Thermococci archaeon]|nr:MAG: hypothetical protein DRN52_04100 [Thermococci archaeon]